MTDDRRQQVDRILQDVLERKPGERAVFLDRVCARDPSLRKEVEVLISSYERAGSFMKSPIEPASNLITAPMPDTLVGQTLGYFRVESLLGAGGMGQVYLAEDTRLGRKVALKVLAPMLVDDSHSRSRFVREARLASWIDHPNICAILDIGESSGRCFIAMQYVEGETLKSVIAERPVPLDTLLSLALQLADALATAHERGVIHRDIKPSNIIITPRAQAKVLDFGLAKLLEQQGPEITRTESVVGTPAYMSPEQARGEAVDHRSDIFSFGAVLYEMATGSAPFRGGSSVEVMHAVIAQPHTPVRQLNPEVAPELAAVIDRALAKAPANRYRSVAEMGDDLRRIASQRSVSSQVAPAPARWYSRRVVIATAVAAAMLAALWVSWGVAKQRWARRNVPKIEELARAGRSFEAYDLAVAVRKYLPEDPSLIHLMPAISDTLSVETEPARARVYLKRFVASGAAGANARLLIGTTPVSNLEIARGDYVLSVEKEGHVPFERTLSGTALGDLSAPILSPPIRIRTTLMPVATAPTGMAAVPGSEYRLVAWRRPTDVRVKLDSYFVDKFEVSNREFKEFVNAGGYLKDRFWTQPFIKAGRTLSREEGMRDLRDRTGLPGPRGWSNQSFPDGKADYPVTGITWYEAAAYAAYRGKSLPTVFQWEKAARDGATIIRLGVTLPWGFLRGTTDYRANFSSTGTVPVGSLPFGMGPFGCYEMAGNVAEWCRNETSKGIIVAGGSWADPIYQFGSYSTYPGFYSSDGLGFRCVLNPSDATSDQGAMRIPLDEEVPGYAPAPEAQVRGWFAHYEYEKSPLGAQIVDVQETDEWRREKIAYNGAGGERALAYLYLPKHFPGPFQVIHLVPAGDVWFRFRSLTQSIETQQASLVRSGRAVFAVVMRGFIERNRPVGYVEPAVDSIEFVEDVARQIADMRRGLDYLETRDDVDASRIAFFQASATRWATLPPALESRYRSVVLWGAGIRKEHTQWRKEANPIHFAPLVRAPKLLVHGLYDEMTPLRTEAEPLFRLLHEPKRVILFDGGHSPSPEFLIPKVNAWLDETLGPVRRN